MTTWFLSKDALERLLVEREGQAVFGPTETKQLSWFDAPGELPSVDLLSQPRSAQSPKGFFLPAVEMLARYGREVSSATTAVLPGKLILFGVRACELRARGYLDHVFLQGDFEDPAYRRRRENTTVIACDCVDCTETCCCTLVGGLPYATQDYDANITPLENGYLVDVATERGEAWFDEGKDAPEATADQLSQRENIRARMVERLKRQNERFTFKADDQVQPELPEIDDPRWQKFAADCVECGACTNICPTCHCFYLFEQEQGRETYERVRNWDSCLLSTYHRMAGGVHMKLSPRPKLFSRLANRILHKFTYSPQQYGMMGCVGCGRCVEACLGAIDIREVVEELAK